MTNTIITEKAVTGNPHAWFDEGKVAPATTSRRGSLSRCENVRTAAISLLACVAMCANSASAGANKFIAAGWEFNERDVDALLDIADDMDETPVDGCVVYLNAKGRDGKAIETRTGGIFGETAWDYADVEPLVPKFRRLLAHKSFRHSFLDGYRAPKKRVAWGDDAAWAKIAHNLRVLAKFAKACGFVGFRIDPEDYQKQCQYVRIDADGMPYEELSALVRRRGRELFSSVFEEFPDIKILSYFLLSMGYTYMGEVDGRNLQDFMLCAGFDLWPHFVDGIFDVLPPSATLIEGNESAYSYRAEKMKYLWCENHVKNSLSGLLSPENRAKYRMQVQNSFGVYLDGYSTITNYNKYGYYMEPIDGSRTRHLAINLKQAVEAADEYIWFWGERSCWTSKKRKTWKDLMPGLYETLLSAKSPDELGRLLRQQMESGELMNLVTNSACRALDAGKVPKPYLTWQESLKSGCRQGVFGVDLAFGHGDTSSLVAEGVGSGCFVCSVGNRRPGEIVGISFCSKGKVSIMVGWQKGGKWDWTIPSVFVPVSGKADADGWIRTDWCVTIPDGADGFGLMLGVRQCDGEKAWFDDIMAISLNNQRNENKQ